MLESFRKAGDWVGKSGGDVFPTLASFHWFVRRHREELVSSQQYLPRKGSAGALVGPRFEDVVIAILVRECLSQDAAAAQTNTQSGGRKHV